MELDEKDVKILNCVSEGGYKSIKFLSERTCLSRFIVKNKINDLVSKGVVKGQSVIINPYTFKYLQDVFFEFKTNPNEPLIVESLEKLENCETLDGISGEYSIIAKFRFKHQIEFKNLLDYIDKLMSKSIFKKYRIVNVVRIYKEFGIGLKEDPKIIDLDDLDFKIIEILKKSSIFSKKFKPINTTEISKILKTIGSPVSQPTVHKRISRLESKKVILKRILLIDHRKIKRTLKFILRIKVNPRYYERVALGELIAMSDIIHLYRTSEDYGLLAVVRAENVEAYNTFLMRLYNSGKVLDTHSTLVLDERKKLSVLF